MTSEVGKHKAETAKVHHERGEYEPAVESYTAAAYEYFGENGLEHTLTVARGLKYLEIAAVILRHQNHDEQCRNRCWQGVSISDAVAEKARSLPREPHAYDQSVRGVWYEFAADFRTIGCLPDRSDAYSRAEEFYADAGNPKTASFEQFHMAVAVLPKVLIRGTGGETDELDAILRPGPTLTDWIGFKRRLLPEALDRLDDQDDWTYIF